MESVDSSLLYGNETPLGPSVGLDATILPRELSTVLRLQRALMSTVLDMIDVVVLVLRPDGTVLDMNRACRRMSGRTPAELAARPFWETLVPDDEAELVHGVFQSALAERAVGTFAGDLLGVDGARHRVAWSLGVVCDDQDQVEMIALAGVDCRRQEAHAAELRQTRSVADEVIEALDELEGTPTGAHAPEAPDTVAPGSVQRQGQTRSAPRRASRCRRRIAPMFGGVAPSPRKFFEVECRDVGPGGIALILDRPPDFEFLVVALGNPPKTAHFTARVVRVAGVTLHGRKKYLVGCSFTDKAATHGG